MRSWPFLDFTVALGDSSKTTDGEELERCINDIPGAVCNGLFTLRKADILIVAGPEGVFVID